MDLEKFEKQAGKDIKSAHDLKNLEQFRIKYLGRKGELSKFLKSLAGLSLEEKRTIGPKANQLKNRLENLFRQKLNELQSAASNQQSNLDLTRPGKKVAGGHLHPLTIVENKIREIFSSLNFSVIEGPEVETSYYNFEALNIPADHPARDMWDTLYLKSNVKGQMSKVLLRTHTSPAQIHYMEAHQPPFQIIVPGRVFRHEATDFSHEFNFHQFEGLMVGDDISLANFKFIVSEFFNQFFNRPVQIRFRPSYFPFTEPSVEVDIKLNNKWLEVMGAGMVHPNVFKAVKYNPEEVQGFAFGCGIERLAMIKYGIPDIRLFHSGDLRFIRQL